MTTLCRFCWLGSATSWLKSIAAILYDPPSAAPYMYVVPPLGTVTAQEERPEPHWLMFDPMTEGPGSAFTFEKELDNADTRRIARRDRAHMADLSRLNNRLTT